ncbi:MAG: hypothetical protein R3D52_11130 [Xanthobacteraceae bacterium]
MVGAARYWRGALQASDGTEGAMASGPGAAWSVLRDIVLHREFNKCIEKRVGDRPSYKSHMPLSHMAVFFGFGGLFITTMYWPSASTCSTSSRRCRRAIP